MNLGSRRRRRELERSRIRRSSRREAQPAGCGCHSLSPRRRIPRRQARSPPASSIDPGATRRVSGSPRGEMGLASMPRSCSSSGSDPPWRCACLPPLRRSSHVSGRRPEDIQRGLQRSLPRRLWRKTRTRNSRRGEELGDCARMANFTTIVSRFGAQEVRRAGKGHRHRAQRYREARVQGGRRRRRSARSASVLVGWNVPAEIRWALAVHGPTKQSTVEPANGSPTLLRPRSSSAA